MPFGLVFGAFFFGVLCTWLGLEFLIANPTPAKAAGVLLILLGLTQATGLLLRRSWARWSGIVCAVGLGVFSLWLIQQRSGVLDILLLFASVAALGLLLVPATGSTAREAQATGSPESRSGGSWGLLGATTALSSVGLVAIAGWAYQAQEQTAPKGPVTLPASVLGERIGWSDFGSGLALAEQYDKPVLVTFVTAWCGYCKKMDRTTWKNPSVIQRLGEIVAVRVDTEDAQNRNGFTGPSLAQRYQVRGTPGTVLSRADGYQSAGDLLDWLDRSLPGNTGSSPLRVSGS
jgi:thiol:disulfide interchange protein